MLNDATPCPNRRDRRRRAVVLIAAVEVPQSTPRTARRVRDHRMRASVGARIALDSPRVDAGHREVRPAAFHVQRSDGSHPPPW